MRTKRWNFLYWTQRIRSTWSTRTLYPCLWFVWKGNSRKSRYVRELKCNAPLPLDYHSGNSQQMPCFKYGRRVGCRWYSHFYTTSKSPRCRCAVQECPMYTAVGVSLNPSKIVRRVNLRGKVQAVQKETISRLVELLVDSNSDVKASAAGALAL